MSLQYIADFDSAEAHSDEVWAVKWLPSGAILSVSADGTLRAWHAASGVALGEPTQVSPTSIGVVSLSINAAGDRALTTSLDASVALWDLSGVSTAVEEATTRLKEHEEQRDVQARQGTSGSSGANGASGTTGAQPVVAALEDLTRVGGSPIKLISRSDSLAGAMFGQGSSSLKSSKPYCSALHPTKPMFASTGKDASVFIYSADPETFGKPVQALIIPERNAGKAVSRFGTTLSFSPDGELIAVGTTRETFVFSVSTGTLLLTLADHAGRNLALAFSTTPSGASNHLYVGAEDQTITMHDVLASSAVSGGISTDAPLGSTIGHLQGHSGWITGVEPAGDGRILASCSTDGSVKLWDLATTPKACVMTATSESGGSLWGISWKPVGSAAQHDAEDGPSVIAKMPRSTAFVTAGSDGRIRFYRSAGVAQT